MGQSHFPHLKSIVACVTTGNFNNGSVSSLSVDGLTGILYRFDTMTIKFIPKSFYKHRTGLSKLRPTTRDPHGLFRDFLGLLESGSPMFTPLGGERGCHELLTQREEQTLHAAVSCSFCRDLASKTRHFHEFCGFLPQSIPAYDKFGSGSGLGFSGEKPTL